MYDDLERLSALRDKGAITEEEYQKEKQRVLDALAAKEAPASTAKSSKLWGMDERGYCTLLHVSQFAGILVPFAGFILPVVMWITGKEHSETVDKHGKAVLNWMISLIIYLALAGILCVLVIGIPLLILLAVLNVVFVIKGAMKANDGELYEYPMTIKIL